MLEICLYIGKGLRATCTKTSFNNADGTALSALNIEVHAVPSSSDDVHDDARGQGRRDLGAVIKNEPEIG